ncbi:hypothetical protein DPMN_124290 [Dreissena polymorpha]|uniref:Uncharacterized protein n=1 Tax=Dreissena polymorpha TaxID=45954 RepID=A0A9D4GW47_DREPO|nr:hypothetical protein DPMN_124290 [Dreissena polymorpha]
MNLITVCIVHDFSLAYNSESQRVPSCYTFLLLAPMSREVNEMFRYCNCSTLNQITQFRDRHVVNPWLQSDVTL